MQISRLWAIASAEMRSCRRLARTWVITVLAMIGGIVIWLYFCLAHMFASYVSTSAGTLGPHFAIANIGKMILLWFAIGILFLAFDIRQRDVRDRIGETIDVRPMSNFELVSGRLFGIVLLLSIPVITLIVLICGYGVVAELFNLGFGSAIEPFSVAAFLVWDVAPNLLLWGALTMFVAVAVRYRFLAVAISLLLLFGYYYLSSRIPFFLASTLSTYTGDDTLPSAIAPQFFNLDTSINRTCVMVVAIGLLGLTAAIYPRQANRQERQVCLATGCVSIVIAVFGVFALVNSKLHELEQVDQWASLHKEFQTHSNTDIEAVTGEVKIFPGRSINLDLVLTLMPKARDSADTWVFSLNPGYKIVSLSLNGQENEDYDFENGLLTVPMNGMGSAKVNMRLVAKGVPTPSFAYLDSSLTWLDMNFTQALAARRFGTKSYIFHPQFVALVPGVSWFPSSGSAYGRTNLENRAEDFFHIDIHVSVPKQWLVAGPGTRTLADQGKRARYRFHPTNPVAEVALIGSNFERRSLSVEGTTFELLLSKKHTKNLNTLEKVVPALEAWIADRLVKANKLGLRYPYETLSFVEVPVSMRTYGGGWRMDSVYSPPGIQMIRESGLPIARFDYVVNTQNAEITDDEEKLEAFMLELLQDYFANDFEGGNPFHSLGRNFVSLQTKPHGSGATALDFLVGELANKLVTGIDGYFSIHSMLAGNRASELDNSLIQAGGSFGYTPSLEKFNWRQQFSDKPSVWTRAIKTSLSDLDFEQDSMNAFHTLLLKTDAYARQLMDILDESDIGSLLFGLVSKYKGTTYSEKDLYRTALNAGLDIEGELGEWLHTFELPGFILANAKLEKLEGAQTGESVYQTSFLIRNDESVSGYVTILYGDESELDSRRLQPLRVPSHTTLRVALQSNDHPRQVFVEPYLSLNRETLRLDIVEHDDDIPTTTTILPYVSEVDWDPHEPDTIIVDDLDSGFTASSSTDISKRPFLPKWVTYLFGDYDSVLETDHGILQLHDASESLLKDPFNSNLWYRETHSTSYGKYRHTHTINFQQTEQTQLKFSANIPQSGKWKLEFHMPAIKSKWYTSKHSLGPGSIYPVSTRFKLARFQLELKNRGLSKILEFDAQEAADGWNDLGLFDLDLGTVDVVLTPKSSGRSIGDAIKWTLERAEN